MELQFETRKIRCMTCILSQVQDQELTQELDLPEGTGETARILGVWGQVLLRGKQWGRDTVQGAGGVQVRVLVCPEEGGIRTIESWIPFRMDWEIPGDSPEGILRLRGLLRYADARPVSAGKVLVRCGVALQVQAWVPAEMEVPEPRGELPGVELLRSRWPVLLPREAGEKAFDMEEELNLPSSAPRIGSILHIGLEPVVAEQKVLGNRLVFRGTGKLHLIYLCPEGKIRSWDCELPFSQYTDLQESHSTEARGQVTAAVTRLETEGMEDGRLQLRCALTGQYLVDDPEVLETLEDAYALHRTLEMERRHLELPGVLESRREVIRGEQTLPLSAREIVEVTLWEDFPRLRWEGETLKLQENIRAQVLWQDEQGKLQMTLQRMEGEEILAAHPNARVMGQPGVLHCRESLGGDSLSISWELPVDLRFTGGHGLDAVTAVKPGSHQVPDPARPSLVLRRAEGRLWDLARDAGSTVDAIRQANGLTGEPEPGKMLLIPVM